MRKCDECGVQGPEGLFASVPVPFRKTLVATEWHLCGVCNTKRLERIAESKKRNRYLGRRSR